MHVDLATRLTAALSLDGPPVAVSFVQAAPDSILDSHQAVPSSCSFWRAAEHGTFYAPADAHFHCPIGAMVMGFELPERVGAELGELMAKMCECSYLDPAEGPNVPIWQTRPAGVVYGPLAEHPSTPDVVLLWLTPRQAMVCNEAIGSASWSSEAGPRVTGRPACAALPLAVSTGTPVTSYGCAGMRTFTEVSDDRMLFVIPGSRLAELATTIETAAEVNRTMDQFYRDRQAGLANSALANSGLADSARA